MNSFLTSLGYFLAAAVIGRLLDFDEKVRLQAVMTICDLAISNLSCFPSEVVLQAIERLRDKKVNCVHSRIHSISHT